MKKNMQVSFTVMQFVSWASMAIFGQFYTYYLMEKGFNSYKIGLVLITSMIAGILGQNLWGYISDKNRSLKKPYLAIIIIQIAAVVLFWMVSSITLGVFVAVVLVGLSFTPKEAILDSWIMSSKNIDNRRYGIMRAAGSFGYALVCTVIGSIYNSYGWHLMFIFFIAVCIFEIVYSLGVTDIAKVDSKEKLNIKALRIGFPYYVLLIYALVVNIGNLMLQNFYPFLLESVGGNEIHLGIAAAVAAFVEMPVLIGSSKFLGKIQPMRIFLLAAFMYGIRVALTFFSNQPIGLILAAVFQALGFSLTLSAGRFMVAKIAPDAVKTSAQTMFSTFFFGISGIVSSLLGGYLWDNASRNIYFGTSALFVAFGIIVMFIANIKFKVIREE